MANLHAISTYIKSLWWQQLNIAMGLIHLIFKKSRVCPSQHWHRYPPPSPHPGFLLLSDFFSLIFVTAQCKHSIVFSLTPSGGISLSLHYKWTLNSNQYLYVHVFFFRRTWYRTMWCRYSCWWTWSPADSRDRSSSPPSANYSIRTRSSTWWTADHYLGKGALTLIKHAIPVPLGPIYTKRESQCCENSKMTLVILLSLKTMELLQNGLQPIFIVPNENSVTSVTAELSQHWLWRWV